MSSAATAGPPPNYPHHNSNGGRPVGITNGFKQNGDAVKKSDRVFKDIKDLVAAKPEIDIHAPIRTILLVGEQHAKQAESYFDFHRPDFALEEYIKASIVAVELIPRHKEYPDLQSDRGELHRLYAGLKKRINSQQDRFDEAKKIIKENNARNGTRSVIYSDHTNPDNDNVEAVRARPHSFDRTSDKGWPSHSTFLPQQNGVGSSASKIGKSPSHEPPVSNFGKIIDKRPAIHPKPEALQGRSIKPKSTLSQNPAPSVEDLTTRFARLRGAENKSQVDTSPSKFAPVQDPRIRTRPIVVPPNSAGPIYASNSNSSPSHSRGGSLPSRPNRPLGPRDLPSAPSRPLKIALGVEIPEMPRPPEAVYSPARSLDSNSHGEILTQHPQSFKNSITRAPSMDSTKDPGRGFMNVDDGNPYFYSSPVSNPASTKKPVLPDLSGLRGITAQQLQQFMQIGSHGILLVDIRNREDFDNGHIMWHSIICIEPLTLRAGVSAEEIEQSLVISPDSEQQLYMARSKYSLVVYYDQSTSSYSKSPNYGKEMALQDFREAVWEYSYEKPLQSRPLLLEGGLDAWIDLIGEGALATSKSSLAVRANANDARNSRTSTRPVPGAKNGFVAMAEAQESDNKDIEDQGYFTSRSDIQRDDIAEDFYYKTADDFMRRFPAVSDIQESMISPSHRLILASQVPARPEKAVTPGVPLMFSRLNSTGTATDFSELWGSGQVGLYNRGNLCYMNAATQALSSVHEIRDYLFRGNWVRNDPNKDPPANLDDQQLATKTFSNLLMHLWAKDASPKCDFVNPRTFVATINRLHMHHLNGSITDDLFGGRNQLDSHEFLLFLLGKICRETQTTKYVVESRTDEFSERLDNASLPGASNDAYQSLRPDKRPAIEQLLNHMWLPDCMCRNCNKPIRLPDTELSTEATVSFPQDQPDNQSITLYDLLERGRTDNDRSGYQCRHCNKEGGVVQVSSYLVNFPNILIIQLARGQSSRTVDGKSVATRKVKAKVQFPEDGLDLTGFRVPGSQTSAPKYDCFAVVCHIGDSLRSGHYTAYRRDMAKVNQNWAYGDWYLYNDTHVEKSAFSRIAPNEAYILFYRRRGSEGQMLGK